MYKLLVQLAVVGCALVAALPGGRVSRPAGGFDTNINRFPYVVSVQHNGEHVCGGVVYSDRVIITAASCLQDITPEELQVRAGSTNWNSGGTLANASSFITHEDYNPETLENDIAVIRLIDALPLGATIRRTILGDYTPVNQQGLVSGWGSRSENGPIQPTLFYSIVTTIANSVCSSDASNYGSKITGSLVCAANNGTNLCQGATGGPLVVDLELVGIVSWGFGCKNTNNPGVFTNTAYYRLWIFSAIRKL